MATLERNTQYNFRTNADLLARAKDVFSNENLDMTAGLNLYLEFVATKGKLPFLSDERAEREILIAGLQKRVSQNLSDLENGEGISLDNARKQLLG
ncbi:MAG: toxin-antitoxin system antitoxin subunit [Streptococcaceae bacterium]|jgi:antitoxin component of RelBE/YafQ-DinJ toxin-antitoxin module|nr:toxin-antitoxin system antitoxin subunit [Streptococcaceae bacterium]